MAQEVVLLTEWRERLKRQSESGLTVEAFCQKEGVSTSMFYRWQRHLQNPSPVPPASEAVGTTHRSRKKRGGRTRRQPSEVAPATESAVKQPQEFLRLPVRNVRSMPWIELTLVDGTVVRIPQENHAALSTVLQILRPAGSGLVAEARHA
jgi:predicted DNA-binding transcriptional regulator AlpA